MPQTDEKEKKRLKLANPNKMYTAPNGTVVQGNAVVEFDTPLPPEIQLKIAHGVLIETDEPVAPNTHRNRGNMIAVAEPRWVHNRPPHQKVHTAPSTGRPSPLGGPVALPSPVPARRADKHKSGSESESEMDISKSIQADLDDLRAKLTGMSAEVGQRFQQLEATLAPLLEASLGHAGQLSYLQEKLAEAEDALGSAKTRKEKAEHQERIDDLKQQIAALTSSPDKDGG